MNSVIVINNIDLYLSLDLVLDHNSGEVMSDRELNRLIMINELSEDVLIDVGSNN